MRVKDFIIKALPFSILLITIASVKQWSRVPLGNTFVWYAISIAILYLLFLGKRFFNNTRKSEIWPIKLFLICLFASFIHGAVISEYYWDWKLLVANFMIFMLPVTIYAYSNPLMIKNTFKFWFKYVLILFPLFVPIVSTEAYGRYLFPISICLLFFPRMPIYWKIFGLAVIMFIVIVTPDSRSNVIKFIVPLCFSMILYLRKSIVNFTAIIGRWLFLALPMILFVFGVTGAFNVFEMSDYLGEVGEDAVVVHDDGSVESLLTDSRSLLYIEELTSALDNDYWLFGRSMARGYDTISFIAFGNEVQEETNRNERPNCEVSVLNIFNYFGLVGVVIYFLIFFTASYYAVHKSNSVYIKLLGLYVAFRWCYAWVEDFSKFDLNYFFLWVIIGMCFSLAFRKMEDKDFEIWFKSIFGNKRFVFK